MSTSPIFDLLDKADAYQSPIILKLTNISKELNKSAFHKLFSKQEHKSGIYLYGGVGTGKTMIMEAFFQSINISKKLVHYQDFMQSIHKSLHTLHNKSKSDVMSVLAKEYAKSKVICIDEFEIYDITDAMLIAEFLHHIIQLNVFIFITSNTEPKFLYKDGLKSELFTPTIQAIYHHLDVLLLDNTHDYRMDNKDIVGKILYPINSKNTANINNTIQKLTNNQYKEGFVEVFGRKITFEKVADNILITNFTELFLRDLGYVDYVNICQKFSTIILTDVEYITANSTDLAIRFINFIDNAYFYKIKLFITACDSIENIYTNGRKIEQFKRTISRLHEMNSRE